MRQRWDYLITELTFSNNSSFGSQLALLGEEGWELVRASSYRNSGRECIFKRPRED